MARHGEAEYETREWADEGGSLTSLGRQQAAAARRDLAGRRVSHVWTSTLARAVQTAEIVAARLGVGVTTRWGSGSSGSATTPVRRWSLDPFLQIYLGWLEGDLDQRIPGGESGREIADRVGAVLREVADAHPGETVLVVSHGGDRPRRPGSVPDGRRAAQLANTATVEVLADADAWVCTRWG